MLRSILIVATGLFCKRDLSQPDATAHDSIHMCAMTQSYAWHDSLNHMNESWHTYEWSHAPWHQVVIGLFCKRARWRRLVCSLTLQVSLENIVSFIGLFCKRAPHSYAWQDSHNQHRKNLLATGQPDATVHDLFTCVPWLICMCDMTHSTNTIQIFLLLDNLMPPYTTHSYVCHNSFVCATWLVQPTQFKSSSNYTTWCHGSWTHAHVTHMNQCHVTRMNESCHTINIMPHIW